MKQNGIASDKIEQAAKSAWLSFRASAVESIADVDSEEILACVKRRDWQHIITAIVNSGVSLREISRKLNIGMQSVQRWRDDPRAEPRDSYARKLMVLYRRATNGG